MNSSRLLVVEDEAIVAMDIENRLAAMGYDLAGSVTSGERALEIAEQQRPDLILMDIRLQGDMDGIAVAGEIRKRFNMPVIFLTAYSEDATLERAKLAEPYGYILKPFDDRELKSAIEIALYKHKAAEEIRRLNRLYDVLSQVNQAVVRTQSREELLRAVCRLMVERGAIDLAWIGWLDPATASIDTVASFGNRREILDEACFFADDRSSARGNPWKAVRKGEPFVCNECPENGRFCPVEKKPVLYGFQSFGSFPLRFQGQVHGVLNLCIAESGFFREREIELLKEVAMDISFALDKIEGDAQRVRAEAALVSERARLHTLVNTIPDMVWLKDPQGIYLAGNPAFERFMGVKEAELLGKTDYDFFPRELAEFFRGHDQSAVQAGKPVVNEEWVTIAEDGSRILLETIKTPMSNDLGQLVGVLGIARDITATRQAEEALRASEERLRLFIENAPASLAMFDREMRYLSVSPRWLSDYNLGDRNLIGLSHYEVFPEIPEYWKAVHRRALAGEAVWTENDRFQRADGSVQWLRWEVRPWRDQAGNLAGVVIFSEDISARKEAEKALQESEERFRQAMEATSDGLWDWDVATGNVYYSPGYFRMLGYEQDEFPGNIDTWLELVHPDDRERARAAMEACICNHSSSVNVEFRMRFREGDWRWILGRGKAARRDAAGRAIQMIGTHVDISAQKQAEETLRQRIKLQDQFAKIAASVPGVVHSFRLKPDGSSCMSFATPAFEDLFGIPREVLAEDISPFYANVHPEDLQHVKETVAEAARLPSPWHDQYRYLHPTKGLLWIEGWAMPQSEPDGSIVWHGFVMDTTEHKRLEEERFRVEAQLRQAQKMEALGTLAGGIAHDFNNILGIIIGYTEMAELDAGAGSPLEAHLAQVFKAAYRARDLVQQILAFARQSEQEKRPMQIGLIVKETTKMLRASLPSTIEVRANVDSKTAVLGDPTQIHQVLMNLCTNAAHAMLEHGGVLDVTLKDVFLEPGNAAVRDGLQPGQFVRLEVKDTGHGIHSSALHRIFDPFFTTKELGVGTGLGLSVVHGIVRSLGGTIEVESFVGKGTKFEIFLPAMESSPVASEEAPVPLPRGQERILVVDDEPALARAMQQMLERLDYEAEYCMNGIEALQAICRQLKDKPFNLVITDMTMPHMTGTELAGEITKLEQSPPILLCTGFNERINEEKAKDFGISALLMKPVVMSQLARAVRRVLDNKDERYVVREDKEWGSVSP